MTEEINKSDINKMNKIIFEKINEQFEKDGQIRIYKKLIKHHTV